VTERRAVADRPAMAERVGEAALPVDAPGRLVVDGRLDAGRAGRGGTLHERLGVLDEQLYPGRRRPRGRRAGLAGTAGNGLVQEEGGTPFGIERVRSAAESNAVPPYTGTWFDRIDTQPAGALSRRRRRGDP